MCANSPGIFTLSVHAASNFPARKQHSSLDVPLPDGLQDEQYLAAVAEVSVRHRAESRTSTKRATPRIQLAGFIISLLLLRLCCDAGASWSTEQLPSPAGAV
jgi:hypothetical protein